MIYWTKQIWAMLYMWLSDIYTRRVIWNLMCHVIGPWLTWGATVLSHWNILRIWVFDIFGFVRARWSCINLHLSPNLHEPLGKWLQICGVPCVFCRFRLFWLLGQVWLLEVDATRTVGDEVVFSRGCLSTVPFSFYSLSSYKDLDLGLGLWLLDLPFNFSAGSRILPLWL